MRDATGEKNGWDVSVFLSILMKMSTQICIIYVCVNEIGGH
jgi:hypothetical protein